MCPKELIVVVAAILLIPAMGNTSSTQDSMSDIRNEIEALKRGQEAIRRDLHLIKSLLAQKPLTPSVPELNVRDIEFELGDDPIRGNEAARLVLVDFTDYQCSYCGRYARETLPKILAHYVDSGKIRYAVLDAPLPIHKMAPKAAEASLCAREQAKFWEMHDQMMSKQESLDDLSSYAISLNLDMAQFEDCLKSNKYAEEVAKDVSLASKLGIAGVPSFILAASDSKNPLKVRSISAIRGAQPFSSFQKAIEQALANLPK